MSGYVGDSLARAFVLGLCCAAIVAVEAVVGAIWLIVFLIHHLHWA